MSSNFVLLSPALSPDALPLNQTRRRDRTGRLLILILIVILLGLGSWRLRVRLRLRLGRNHSALIQWRCSPVESPLVPRRERERASTTVVLSRACCPKVVSA